MGLYRRWKNQINKTNLFYNFLILNNNKNRIIIC